MILLIPTGIPHLTSSIKYDQVVLGCSSVLSVLIKLSRRKQGKASSISHCAVHCEGVHVLHLAFSLPSMRLLSVHLLESLQTEIPVH